MWHVSAGLSKPRKDAQKKRRGGGEGIMQVFQRRTGKYGRVAGCIGALQ